LRQQITGFGGRVLDDSLPKYINTPETPIFHKGESLYGLHVAYKSIRDSHRAVVVEGYTDVLALKRHGFDQAVATLGTALTRQHVRRLKGYAKEAVVVFDADSAGKAAAIKSLSSFMNEGLSSRVMVLPEGNDPDSYVNKNGLNSFLALLDASLPMFEYYLDLKLSETGDEVEGQVSALEEIIPVLGELSNASQQSLYVRRLSEKLGVAESAVLQELGKWQKHHSWQGSEGELRERLSASKAKNIDDFHLLNLFIHYPHTVERLMDLDCRVLLSDPVVRGIFDSLIEIHGREGKMAPADILERLPGDPARERFREAMLSSPIYPNDMVEQALEEFEAKIRKIKLAESNIKAIQEGDLERSNRILELKRKREFL
jgi:DNA primase